MYQKHKAAPCTNKTTTNTLGVPTSVLNGVPNVKCTKVQQVYQNLLGMTPSVVNTDPILSVPKVNWCTKRDDYANITQNDQERC